MKATAVYYRVSTDKQDTELQKFEVGRFIAEAKTDFGGLLEYTDVMSGSRDDRPAFLDMLKDARAGKFSTLIVYKLDRLSRSSNTAIMTVLELDALGVAFIATSQPVFHLGPDMPFRKTILAAFAEIAELERQMIRDRILAGHAARKARGLPYHDERPPMPPELKAEIMMHSRAGLSVRNIGKLFGIGKNIIQRVIQEHREKTPP